MRHGYRIIAAPWRRLPYGEIDIVAQAGKELVFVEVKTRHSNAYGFPEEAVTRDKRWKISRLIDWYLQSERIVRRSHRFDIIAIELTDEEPRITHLEGVGIDG